MQRCIAAILLLTSCSLTSCSLDRVPVVGTAELDAGALPDVPGLDAPTPDAPSRDGGESDVPVTVPCTPVADADTTCNRVDDDCNGIVDDSGCRIDSPCVAFTIGGRAYQSCPGVNGLDAWSGACRQMGPGYELASFRDGSDATEVSTRLSELGAADPHYVAANDFDVNGSYVWWNGDTTPALNFAGRESADPQNRCVLLLGDGTYEEVSCKEDRRVLCAADTAQPACPMSEEPTSCNGRDEDCDGRVDEGLACGRGCTASTFWRNVYYVCTDDRRSDQAPGACDTNMGGARVVVINNETELGVLATRTTADTWVALNQAGDAAGVAEGWGWGDTAVRFGVPAAVGVSPWGDGEPNDGGDDNESNHQENCGVLREGDNLFDDKDCRTGFDFLCEASWSYGT